ncbi:putative secondary metabolism biosynthetic enzyme [Aspergillus luchuensis]|nr:putative secondary metabolism biosynthetic enzyme [Aspergillus luchuensis]
MNAQSNTKAFDPPAPRVPSDRLDVWSIVNEAAAVSPIQPIVNLGQGFFGFNPPQFAIDAAKEALNRVDCNQCAPTKGRPSLRKAIASAYSNHLERPIDEGSEVVITSGANEAFICPGDEVVTFEPFFDQYRSGIELAGGIPRYVPLHPPKDSNRTISSASEWTVDFEELEKAINKNTKMIILNTPHNPVGKVFTEPELQRIGDICLKHDLLILSDEVYDHLYYVPFTRIATLSPDLYNHTLTVASAGKAFHATGWRIGYLIGPQPLIKNVSAIHTRICYSSVSPLQEAVAVAFEKADENGFWEHSRQEMKGKLRLFCEVFEALGLPVSVFPSSTHGDLGKILHTNKSSKYTEPEGGYFVLVNLSRVQIPSDYSFPAHIEQRRRDFKLCWFLIQEIGVAAIPPSEFYSDDHAHIGEDFLRFAFCKEDEVLEMGKQRLLKLKRYIV